MPEATTTCLIHQKHPEIECDILPGYSDGFCILHSRDQRKDIDSFRLMLKGRLNRVKRGFVDLRGVFFPEGFDAVSFFGTKELSPSVDFSSAIFSDYAIFSEITFVALVRFHLVTFMESALFSETTFKELADFSGCTFLGKTIFRAINEGNIFRGDFISLNFRDEGILRFQDLSLSQVQFAGSDLRRIEFHHVQWLSYRGRQSIFDEAILRKNEKEDPWFLKWLSCYAPYADPPSLWGDRYGEIERLYRYLKINYEGEGDYKNAGDFHYGELEMHRRASKWRWFPLYWYNLYRLLSGYGERPSWALGWLAVFLIGIGGLVWGLGLDVINPPHIAGFGDSFIYILQKATLQRPTWAEPMGFWGKLVAGFSVLLIPGQAALFLLALRNRLGRRR